MVDYGGWGWGVLSHLECNNELGKKALDSPKTFAKPHALALNELLVVVLGGV